MPRIMHLPLVTLSLLLVGSGAAAHSGGPADAAPRAVAGATAGILSLRLTGFRSARGQVLIAVFRGADGFPGAPERAWRQMVVKISGDGARADISELEPGEYAVSVVHDENGNNALDTSWLGIPREGIGVSNNARGRLGPPRYRDAKFTVTAAGAVQVIDILYM